MSIERNVVTQYSNGQMFEDSYIYVQNQDFSISRYDLLTKEEELYFDYNYCDANISDIENSSLQYCKNDEMVFFKNIWDPGEFANFDTSITLRKNEMNPNIGKKVMFVASVDNLNYFEAEGIRSFNENNDSVYCYVTAKYNPIFYFSDTATEENYIQQKTRAELSMLSTLQQDIISGSGPDILIGFGKYSILNSDKYLLNLLPVLKNEILIDETKYFNNFFDAYTKGEKLYQIPLSATTSGIYTRYVNDESKIGFTYDEYYQFVEKECSGFDPAAYWYGRDVMFETLEAYNYEDFYDEKGNLSIDNEAFRKFSEYIARFPEEENETDSAACNFYFNNMSGELWSMIINENKNIYGYPSIVEKGGAAHIYESIAITTCSILGDEANDLVASYLSYEIQKSHKNHNPICVKAFDEYANIAIEIGNSDIELSYGMEDFYSADAIEEYKSYLSRATVPMFSDTITLSIMMEELQPYFAGQKSIDDVIPVIESRVNTMLEERK